LHRRSVALLLGLVSLACAHAPWHPYRGWTAYHRDDLTLYTDTAIEYRSALDWMAGISEVYRRTFFRELPVAPMHVLYLQEDAPSPLTTSGGTYRYGSTLLGLPRATDGGRGLVVVGRFPWEWNYAHFVAHHFIDRAMPGAPLWFQEGFAEYLTFFRSSPSASNVVCFGLIQPGREKMVVVPVKDLLAVTWKDYNETSAPWIAPSALALIDYLLHGEGGRWRPRFRGLLQALAARQPTETAFETAYPGLPLASLDARLRDHVQTVRPPNELCPLPVVVGPRVDPVTPPSEAPVSEEGIRGLFEAIERLPVRRGFADFIPPADR
jgi:hypothetical protein